MVNKKETGADGALVITGYDGEVPVTNVSYDLDADTSESQFMGNYTQSIAFTGVSYSGSFEHDGSNEELMNAVRNDDGIPQVCDNLVVKESERTVIFKNVIVETVSRDVPGDDRTSTSYDFVAEKVNIKGEDADVNV